MTIVLGAGRLPNQVLLCGEAPGREEAAKGIPFVGRSGHEQDRYLARHGLNSRNFYRTNIVKEYIEGNPDPSPEQVDTWTPVLLNEIEACQPRLVVAVGRFAARWFLGEQADMDTCHGLPHKPGAFDPSRIDRAPAGCVILPVYHPAAGFYDIERRSVIAWDYSQVASVLAKIQSGKPIQYRYDEFESRREVYADLSGEQFSRWLLSHSDLPNPVLAIDTEGTPDRPWSLQVSLSSGTGVVLRTEHEDFDIWGVHALREYIAERNPLIVMHNAMYDLEMLRAMGLDLSNPAIRIYDTMYAAYLLRIEPQGLKPLAYRWCGMSMQSHREMTSALGLDRQISYLQSVVDGKWLYPGEQVIFKNDGTVRVYKPQPIERRAASILRDLLEKDPFAEEHELTDPVSRWNKIDRRLRKPVEDVLGPIPIGSVGAVFERDPQRAIHYAARDADATLRLHYVLSQEIQRQGLSALMETGMQVLPIFEQMQSTGMPASKLAFESLADRMQTDMQRIQHEISTLYFDGRPFNPNSRKNVSSLMLRRGLHGAKLTKTRQVSTSEKSIKHLEHKDPAIKSIFEWRKRRHTKDSFCDPVLDLIPDDVEDTFVVRCQLLPTRTTTRRLASKRPNLLAMPKHSEFGKLVRGCYVCPPGEVFAEFDFSQIETRVLAHESQDPLLCELLNSGRDIHSETASRIFNVPIAEVTKLQRFYAKRVNFGVPYGVQGSGLADQIRIATGSSDWDDRTCDKYIRDYLRVYHGVASYINEVETEVARIEIPGKAYPARKWTIGPGAVVDICGMIRYLPAVWSDDRKLAAEAKRQAVNHRIQGGAQGLIQNAMAYLRPIIWNLQQSGLNIHWTLQVHDSVILRISEELYELISEIVLDAFKNHCGMQLRVPVLAEGSMARSWGELK